MTASIRDAITKLPQPRSVSNAALELDRYVTALGDKSVAVKHMYTRVCEAKLPDLYPGAYRRWEADLRALARAGCYVIQQPVQVRTRMIVGLGAESSRETSITLHPLYGVPIIPGSAAKGLARRYADKALGTAHPALAKDGADFKRLFGELDDAGYITFHDAWHIPETDLPLRRDIITVHHPKYYATRGKPDERTGDVRGRLPWDFDDPNPVPYLTAVGRYTLTVTGPSAEWSILAMQILMLALKHWGIGAKTEGSNYGRIERVPSIAEDADNGLNAVLIHPDGAVAPWAYDPSASPAAGAAAVSESGPPVEPAEDAAAGAGADESPPPPPEALHPLAAQIEPKTAADLTRGELEKVITAWGKLQPGEEKLVAARQILAIAQERLADWQHLGTKTYILRRYLREHGGT